MSITLSDMQFAGAQAAEKWYSDACKYHDSAPFVLTGYAGSGKSTCVGAIVEEIGLGPEQVMYMAPTGKAAKVLTRKLKESGWPSKATTIHKAIYMPKGAKADAIDREIEDYTRHILWIDSDGKAGRRHWSPEVANWDKKRCEANINTLTIELAEIMDREGPKFNLKSQEEIPSGVRLFIVDEASMVGNEVAQDLSYFGIPILAIGDPGQLPPVGDDWGFNMEQPDVFLSEIHRQAQDNPIIRLATMAREGKELPIGDYGDGVRVIPRRDDDVTYNVDRDAMVLVGTNKKRWSVTQRIRKELGLTETGPMQDEPLIVCRNSTEYPGLVNGTMLRCTEDVGNLKSGQASFKLPVIDDDAGGWKGNLKVTQGLFEEHFMKQKGAHTAPDRSAFQANKSCEHVDWGHAITVHKSQGSEFEDVALHDESPVFRQDAKRWLYTGVTRASEKLTVLV